MVFIHPIFQTDVSVKAKVFGQISSAIIQLIKPRSNHANFVFPRDPPEPTGEEAEDADLEAPKIYELVIDWEQKRKRRAQTSETNAWFGVHVFVVKAPL